MPAAGPPVAVLACLAAGFVLARELDPLPAALWFSAAGVLATGAAALRRHACIVCLALAAVCIGSGWFTFRLHERPERNISALLGDEAGLVEVEGMVLENPSRIRRSRDPLQPFAAQGELTAFDLNLRAVIDDAGVRHRARGILRVRVPGRLAEPPRAGEFITALGRFEPVPGPLNPGERDQRLWRAQEGVFGSLRLTGGEGIGASAPGSVPARVHGWWMGTRAHMGARARAILLGSSERGDAAPPPRQGGSPPHLQARALLGALILGEEDPSLREVRGAFQRLGLLHALSISGFHLAVMAMVALVLLRAVRDLGWLEPLLASALIGLYIAILPFHAPVWRAGLMVVGLLLAQACGRRYHPIAILCWIAVALLLLRPMDLWSIGFQLSFGLVAALILLGETMHERLWGMQIRGVIRRPVPAWRIWLVESGKRLLSTNLLCWALATPLIMYHIGLVSPLAVLAGIVMVPVISLLLIAGYAALLVGVLVPPLAGPVGSAVEWLALVTAAATGWLDALPGTSMQSPPVSLMWAAAATGACIYWIARGHGRDGLGWVLASAIAAWLAGEIYLSGRIARDHMLRVDALAVGDGTCMLVRSPPPDDGVFLWDCGSLQGRVGELKVPRALRALGIWRVRTIVLSHPNLDHYNGILDLVAPLGVREVVIGEEFVLQARERPTGPEAYLLDSLRARGVEVIIAAGGDRLVVGGIEVEVLSPPPLSHGQRWRHDNDMSLVLGIPAGAGPRYAALLTGDIQQPAMEYLLGKPSAPLRALIAEAPHHGAGTDAAAAFLGSVNPEVVLQSTGPQRAGTPLQGPWRKQGGWLSTAVDGASWAAVDKGGRVQVGAFRRRTP